MSRFWSDLVHQLDPYVPGEQPKILDLIKLNTNENPYPPSPEVAKVYSQENIDLLRLYPDPNSQQLKDTLAQYYSVKPSQVFVGNGSDEVLALAFMAFFTQGKPLLFPDISYSFYPVYCQLYGIEAKRIALDDNFDIAVADYTAGAAKSNTGIIFPNPNAPTGKLLALDAIKALLQANADTVVLVDEAYIDFGGETAITLVDRFDNLLVVQTLSKSRSLAGLRLGFAIGHEDLIDGLDRVKNSFNSYPVDRLAELAAIASINDKAHFDQTCAKIIATRNTMVEGLEALHFEVLDSAANFVFAKPTTHSANEVFQALRARNIIVRYFDKPRISEYLRISVGTDAEAKALLDALAQILG